ncbi:MAG: hypothetical protein IJM24_08685, partial [Clostridia bacterium]|nr:hypothetical protein [Clostridia bacterium]
SISWFLFIFEGKSARKMKMTGYYQFSQALSVAMPESSSAITISGVEPDFTLELTAPEVIQFRGEKMLTPAPTGA